MLDLRAVYSPGTSPWGRATVAMRLAMPAGRGHNARIDVPAATGGRQVDEIRTVVDDDVEAVIALWGDCGLLRPWNDPQADIALARRSPGCALFAGFRAGAVMASVMCGADGHRGWLYYLAVHPGRRRRGLGAVMVRHAEQWLAGRGMPKVELMVREENAAVRDFYRTLGYEVEPRVVMSRWLTR